jgi:hypothetical protein
LVALPAGIYELSLEINLLEHEIIQPFIRIISATFRQEISRVVPVPRSSRLQQATVK